MFITPKRINRGRKGLIGRPRKIDDDGEVTFVSRSVKQTEIIRSENIEASDGKVKPINSEQVIDVDDDDSDSKRGVSSSLC